MQSFYAFYIGIYHKILNRLFFDRIYLIYFYENNGENTPFFFGQLVYFNKTVFFFSHAISRTILAQDA